MNRNVLIINGSARINGNTEIIVNKIIDGSKGNGVDINLYDLKNKNISDCIGCYNCMKESQCGIQDDMAEIYDAINKSELMILASPLYWCGVTALMKAFIDRLFLYYHPQNKKLIAGKKAIIITPMNQKDVEHESEVLVEFYKRLFNCLGVNIVDMFFYGGIMEKTKVMEKPKYIEQSYSLGKRLIGIIENGA